MLALEHFTFGYDGQLLKNALNLKVDSPDLVAILGNNGSGKSTFFSALRERISYGGKVVINNQDLPRYLVTPFVFLGQSYSFGLEIDLEAFLKINLGYDENKETYNFLFEKLEINELAHKSITQLSQGQLQRCLIMQTLLQDAPVYLLDEPESFLDLYFRNVLAETLKEYAFRFKKIIFIATHDLNIVREACSSFINFSNPSPELENVSNDSLLTNKKIIEKKLL